MCTACCVLSSFICVVCCSRFLGRILVCCRCFLGRIFHSTLSAGLQSVPCRSWAVLIRFLVVNSFCGWCSVPFLFLYGSDSLLHVYEALLLLRQFFDAVQFLAKGNPRWFKNYRKSTQSRAQHNRFIIIIEQYYIHELAQITNSKTKVTTCRSFFF